MYAFTGGQTHVSSSGCALQAPWAEALPVGILPHPLPRPGSRVVPRLLYARQGKLDPGFLVFHIIIWMTLHLPLHPGLICLGRRNQEQKAPDNMASDHWDAQSPAIRWSGVSQRCVWRTKWTKTTFLKQKINQTQYKRNRDYFKLWIIQSYRSQSL